MALEIVTDAKNDKTEFYFLGALCIYNKRTRDGTYVLFCVPPSSVLTDNKCIFSCAFSTTEANSPLNESNEELRMKLVFIFSSFFSFFEDYRIKAELDLELLPFISGEPE